MIENINSFLVDEKYLDEKEIPLIQEILNGKGISEIDSTKILVKLHNPPEVTKGGIFLPDMSKDHAKYNTVCALIIGMGPECYKTGPYKSTIMKPREIGQWVNCSYMAPNRFDYKGLSIAIVFDDQIFFRIEDPTTIKRG